MYYSKKILFVFHSIGYGGAAKMLTFMANELVKHGLDVYIVLYRSDGDNFYELDSRIKVLSRGNIKCNRVVSIIRELFFVIKSCKKVSPDCIFSLMSTSSFYSFFASKLFNISWVVSERGDPYKENELGFFSRVKLKLMNYANGGIFQTEGAMKFFDKRIVDNSVIIPNPVTNIDVPYKPFVDRNFSLAFVGRFEISQKRQDLLLKSFAIVNKNIPSLLLEFYGDGPDLEHVKQMAWDLKLQKSVIFHGKVNDVTERLVNSKYFVLSSDYEGIPNALIEAMSCGCAVVSTDCSPGGAKVLIKNGINGLLVAPGNEVELANAIQKLVLDDGLSSSISTQATRVIEEFSPSIISNRIVKYIIPFL